MTHWWQDLFDEKYLRMFAEARPPMQTDEVEALLALLERRCSARRRARPGLWLWARLLAPGAGRSPHDGVRSVHEFLLDAAENCGQAGRHDRHLAGR